MIYPAASTPASSITLRGTITTALWNGTRYTIPTTADQYTPAAPSQAQVDTLFGQAPAAWQWFGHQFHLGGHVSGPGMLATSFFARFSDSTRLAAIALGHGASVFPCPVDFAALIQALVSNGFDIVITPMPLTGENAGFYGTVINSPSAPVPSDAHHHLGTDTIHALPVGWGSRMRYWIDPQLRGIDRAKTIRASLSLPAYERTIMVGHSGGAQTATICAAVEPSIDRSYAVAGSLPAAFRGPIEPGPFDWESEPGFNGLGFEDYFDAYLMAAAEPGRKLWLMYNAIDTSFPAARAKPWARPLRDLAIANGYGDLDVKIDYVTIGHSVSAQHRADIVADAIS